MSDTKFCITHAGPGLWIVKEWVPKFWRGSWVTVDAFDTEKKAISFITKRAEFKPYTSYYDKHGNMLVEPTDW